MNNLLKQAENSYRHNYIGNIFVNLQNGFNIFNIEFYNKEFCIEIVSNSSIIEMIAADCVIYGNFIIDDSQQNRRQKIFK